MKLVYGMGSQIGKTLPIASKLITLYGEVVHDIGPFQALALNDTEQYKVQVKNLTAQEVQISFINGHVIDQQIGRSRNIANKE